MKISCKEVNSIYKDMNSTVSKIKTNLEDVDKKYRELSGGSVWSGIAFENYIEKLKELVSEFENVKIELQNSVNFLNDVVENYKSIDNNIIASIPISSIHIPFK